MNFNEYQEISKRTMPKMIVGKYEIYYDERAKVNYALGLAGEAGELIDQMKKEMFHDHEENDDYKKKELGDILHYLSGLCTMYGYSLEEVATLNVFKLKKRYPNGFKVKDSLSRKDVEK